MDLDQLNGLTPQQLHALILKSPIGFSAEDGSIQYLGKQIQLHNGTTMLSEQIAPPAGSKQLFERLVTLQPDLATQLPGSKAEAIKRTSLNLVEKFSLKAIEISPTKEVQWAVFVQCMKLNSSRTVKKLSKTNSLSVAEKLQIMLAGERIMQLPLSAFNWYLAKIPLANRFEEAKKIFQRFPDTPSLAEDDIVINEQLTSSNPDNKVKDRLLEIRQIFKSENNELATQLSAEVDNLEKTFIPKVSLYGYLTCINDHRNFEAYSRRLLYLYAACSGFSQKSDIAELTSYIRSVLYTSSSDSICHIVKELAYLSKQPGSIDYCRYIDAVANILKAPEPIVLQFEKLKQLSDINGFALLESHKPLAPYLAVLRANIDSITPDYAQVLLPEVASLEAEFTDKSLPENKAAIKAKVHRLLMVIAACKSSRQIMDPSVLAHFVRAIMNHGNKNDIPYLISGLACLVHSTAQIQQILGHPDPRTVDHLRLAPLQLLKYLPEIISVADLEEICKNLRAKNAHRRLMKDTKVFHQWLVTLENLLSEKITDKENLLQVLKKLSLDLSLEKLGLLDMICRTGPLITELIQGAVHNDQVQKLPLLIAEKGAGAFECHKMPFWRWLLNQRYSHLLPVYVASIKKAPNIATEALTALIDEFTQSISGNTFIKARQSPLKNPHLWAVYQKYPEFEAGWGANFPGFSEALRSKLLSPGETLELTEDPWDLFISGFEVKTCQSPANHPKTNCSLMSYVMDGRNAMIVIKNKKGNILHRSLIRMVLDQSDQPVLFLERAYPLGKNLWIFLDAAREIADKMELSLYYYDYCKTDEKLKLLKGRAPYDYFDSVRDNHLLSRQTVTLEKVTRVVSA